MRTVTRALVSGGSNLLIDPRKTLGCTADSAVRSDCDALDALN